MINLFKVAMSEEAVTAAANTLQSGYIGEGEKVKEFEKDLHSYFSASDNTDIITCNSATSAEHLIYHMLKSPRNLNQYFFNAYIETNWLPTNHNTEVITTALTCTATNWPIIHNGFKIVWADIDPRTLNISLTDVDKKITENTRIIQVVHWGGYPVQIDLLRDIVSKAEKKFGTRILIVEDCAHAFGSKYKGEYVGFSGNLSTFSTQAIKHLTTVDGGFIVSPFRQFSQEARILRWYGIDRNQPREDFRCELDIPEIGFKFHMNDVNASIGIENLKHINGILDLHRHNALYYNVHLNSIPGVTLLENSLDATSSYWLYTILVENRSAFMRKMNDMGIMVSRVHERNDKHSSVAKFKTDLPVLDEISSKMVCIPVGWWVTTTQREYIANCIKSGW